MNVCFNSCFGRFGIAAGSTQPPSLLSSSCPPTFLGSLDYIYRIWDLLFFGVCAERMKKTGIGTAVSMADAELLPDNRWKAWIESTLLLAIGWV